jgi:tRNA (mo5U34)-methyltransferase
MEPLTPGDPRLDDWYHTIELGPGVVSKGFYDHRPVLDAYRFPDLTGKRVFDVGTANGFFAFEFERGGASVVALDAPEHVPRDWAPTAPRLANRQVEHRKRFELARAALGSSVEYRLGSVYDLSIARDGLFDVVFCGSLLLHLRNPIGALLALRAVTRERLIVETASDPGLEATAPGAPLVRFGNRREEEERGVPLGSRLGYWWMTGAALEDMLLHAGFRDVEVLPGFELPPTGHPVVVAHAWP